MEMEELVIVVKAYRSGRERAANKSPLEEKEIKTIAEFDEVVGRLYSEGHYVAFSGKSGVKLASRDAARLLLLKAEEREQRIAAILACTEWISSNRPDLNSYLKDAQGLASEVVDGYVVTIGVGPGESYESFSFHVSRKFDNVKQLVPHIP